MKKLFLLDAFALIYRAYYSLGTRFLYNSKGFNTTAVQFFTETLNKLMTQEKPSHLAIAFDTSAPTERHKMVDDYKAGREEMPEDLRISIPIIREIIEAFNIPILELDGYEADDIVGTIAKDAAAKGYTVYMVTPDKDYAQIVDENIFFYKPPNRGKPEEIYGIPEILEKWDIERIDQVIDILGLMGDKVDNIPGVPGVGEKTAIKLLKEFDTIENLLENTDKLKGKLKEKIENNAEQALMSKKLATIIMDVPIKYNFDDFKLVEPNKEKLKALFGDLEFRSLGKRILGDNYNVNQVGQQISMFGDGDDQHTEVKESGKTIENTEHNYICVNDDKAIDTLLKDLLKQKIVCFDTESTGLDANEAELVGLSFAWKKGEAYYVPVSDKRKEAVERLHRFKAFFENEKIVKIAQNIKYDLLLLKWYDIEVKGNLEDTMLIHYLVEPELRHNMTYLSESYLGYSPVSIESLIGKKGKNQGSMRDVELKKIPEYAAEDADITLQLFEILNPSLKENKLTKVYDKVEMPLVNVLTQMEYNGVNLDVPFLKKYSEELGSSLLETRDKIYDQANLEFNIDSPKQLGTVLFESMEIPYKGKKTKTGQFSTNEETLQKLADEHAIVKDILKYRGLTKLKSTYVDALPNIVNPKTNRIHSSFNQAVAATGRLASHNPNLQNIPIRTEAGKKVRKAFIPSDNNHLLLSADYSQVELRLIASLSDDTAMIDAFNNGIDIHTVTASNVYKVALEDVDTTMRRNAKTVNFGIIYGISAFGLSQRLNIPRKEAKELIENYFAMYPKLKEYMNGNIEFAKKNGFVETVMGRKRKLKDINSANRTVRGFAERNAINSPIQGSAADLIKLAMINVYEKMKRKKLKSKLILQVHDELVFDVLKSEKEVMEKLVVDEMSNALKLKVPLLVDYGIGENWLEAH